VSALFFAYKWTITTKFTKEKQMMINSIKLMENRVSRGSLMMYPKVNQNIVIEISREEKTFKSIVAEVGVKEILIGFPMDHNIFGRLPIGTTVDITYLIGDNLYKFKSNVIGKRNDSMPLIVIDKPNEKDIKKIQRRDNFRVKANLSVNVKDHEVTTVDLSGGGLQFTCKENFELVYGEVVSGTLVIPGETEAVTFQGIVRRIFKTDIEDRKNVGVAFTSLNQKDQAKITRYCFEKQRQMRLKLR
jgi:c-di-GMP-binding flagellar brake protein YcgR